MLIVSISLSATIAVNNEEKDYKMNHILVYFCDNVRVIAGLVGDVGDRGSTGAKGDTGQFRTGLFIETFAYYQINSA